MGEEEARKKKRKKTMYNHKTTKMHTSPREDWAVIYASQAKLRRERRKVGKSSKSEK